MSRILDWMTVLVLATVLAVVTGCWKSTETEPKEEKTESAPAVKVELEKPEPLEDLVPAPPMRPEEREKAAAEKNAPTK